MKRSIADKIADVQTETTVESIGGVDRYRYKGWLQSDKFYKRVIAIWGYVAIGWLVLYGVVLFFALLLYAFI